MSLYRIVLEDYVEDKFRLPVSCSGTQLVFDFEWDTIHQRIYDNLQKILSRYNQITVRSLSNASTLIRPIDYLQYMSDLILYRDTLLSFIAYWVPILEGETGIDWTSFDAQLSSIVSDLSSIYIDDNKVFPAINLLTGLQGVQAEGHIAIDVLSAIDALDSEFINYIDEKEVWYLSYLEQIAELEEILRWHVKITYEEEVRVTMLEIGAIHFYQDAVYRVMFDSEKTKIGKNDLGLVTLWVEVRDEFTS
jgi:hypothetical protein